MDPSSASKTLWTQAYENQTILIVGIIVLVHLIGIGLLIGCLWSQSPKSVPTYKLARAERELYKQSIAKND